MTLESTTNSKRSILPKYLVDLCKINYRRSKKLTLYICRHPYSRRTIPFIHTSAKSTASHTYWYFKNSTRKLHPIQFRRNSSNFSTVLSLVKRLVKTLYLQNLGKNALFLLIKSFDKALLRIRKQFLDIQRMLEKNRLLTKG